MPEMNWYLSVKVNGGASLAIPADPQEVEATDSIEVAVPKNASNLEVNLQPGAASQIQLLVIKSSRYGQDLTYTVGDGTHASKSINLDAPQLFSGGSASLFGFDPQKLKLSNTGEDATVSVLVARKATTVTTPTP